MWSRKSPLTQSHGERAKKSVPAASPEAVKEHIVGDSNRSAPLNPSSPRPSLILVCLSRNCSFTGSLRSSEVSQETISFGTGRISKFAGTCEGTHVLRIVVSSLLSRSSSRERASEM